jgi:hypothetical protein
MLGLRSIIKIQIEKPLSVFSTHQKKNFGDIRPCLFRTLFF